MRRLVLLGVVVCSSAYAAPVAKAKLIFGTPTVKAGLDAKAVAAIVQRSGGQLLACYTAGLAKAPELQGTATATFTVGGNGTVVEAAVKGLNGEVHRCISAALMKLEFAKPKDGTPVLVTYPMMFQAGDRPAFSSLTGRDPISDEPAQGATGGKSKKPNVSIGQPDTTGDKAVIRRSVKASIAKILACYEMVHEKDPKLEGTVTAHFTFGADGIVKASTADGTTNKDLQACVAGVIKRIVFPKAPADVAVKYPFTFRPGSE